MAVWGVLCVSCALSLLSSGGPDSKLPAQPAGDGDAVTTVAPETLPDSAGRQDEEKGSSAGRQDEEKGSSAGRKDEEKGSSAGRQDEEKGSSAGRQDEEKGSSAGRQDEEKEGSSAEKKTEGSVTNAGKREEEKEGSTAGEMEAPQETEEERKERVEEELAGFYEELAEASSSVSLQPLGTDRHHHRYWLFPNLPGLFVEDSGLSRDLCLAQRPPVPTSPPPLIHVPPSSLTPTSAAASAQPTCNSPSFSIKPDPSTPSPADSPSLSAPPQLIPVTSSDVMEVDPTLTQLPQSTACQTANNQPSENANTESNTRRSSVRWLCYSGVEEVDNLLVALDVRGVREKALKEALNLYKYNLLRTIDKCQFKAEWRGKLQSPSGSQALRYDSGDQYLELYLREQILDTEEKIHLGNLGHLRGSQSRDEWREVIENSGAAALVNSWKDKLQKEEGGSEGMEGEGTSVNEAVSSSASPAAESGRVKSNTPTSWTNPSVRTLSQALLDVAAGIEHKFLMAPLGNAVDNKKQKVRNSKKPTAVKEADICREQWRASLAQASSFSQVFLHLATLERAVMWSRSLMNVRCRICRRKGGDEYMLLCDGCDHGYHTYCLKPALQSVPEGDWFCQNCSPVTPRKRTQRVTFQEVRRVWSVCVYMCI